MRRFLLAGLVTLLVLAVAQNAMAGWGVPVNLGDLNSSRHETGVFVSPDESFILFAGDLPGCLGVTDLYISYWTGSSWGSPAPLGSGVNTSYKEQDPYLNTEQTILYFISDRPGGLGGADVWAVAWNNGPVGMPANLGPAVNSAAGEYSVAISPDGNELWFSSTRSGGYGAADMYYSPLVTSFWQPAINAGAVLNTDADDGGMSFTADGNTMVLVSDDATGFGSYDLLISTKANGVWGAPVNLGCGINSELVDWSPHITADGDQIYYTPYGRVGGHGESDIWVSNWSAETPHCDMVLYANPGEVSFHDFSGSIQVQSRIVAVSASGGGTIGFEVEEGESWLSVSPNSGSTPSNIEIQVNPTGLGGGEFVGYVHITSPDPSASAAVVTVRLTIEELAVCSGWQRGIPLPLGVNSANNETKPFWTDNDQTLYFSTVGRADGLGNYDIYVSHWNGTTWSTPENLGPAINSSSHDDNPNVSADGNRMVFISRRSGDSHVWMSEKVGGVWQNAVKLGPQVNSAYSEWTVGMNPAGDEIIFSSDRPGGLGHADMYVSNLVSGNWTPAQPLPAPMNSSGDDGAVSYGKDGSQIYFVSDRFGGFGGHDLYVAPYLGNNQYGAPVNLGCGINSERFETYAAAGYDATRLIYVSIGLPGPGASDIYMSYYDSTVIGTDDIYVYPLQIAANAVENGANPTSQKLALTALPGSHHDFSLSNSQSWLTVDPSTGTSPALVDLDFDITGLTAGYHVDTVWVNSPTAENTPIAVPVVLLVTAGPVGNQSEDTVRVAHVLAAGGDSEVAVTVELFNRAPVDAYVMPLDFDETVLQLDSVSFVGSVSLALDPPLVNINNAAGTVLFGGINISGSAIPAGDAVLARLFFTVAVDAENGSYPIVTTFIPPAGSYEFVSNGYGVQPVFKAGSVDIATGYRGDADNSGFISISDAVGMINMIFAGAPLPIDTYRLDANCSNNLNISDAVYLINFIFSSGSAPCEMYGNAKAVAEGTPVVFDVAVNIVDDELIEYVISSESQQAFAASQVCLDYDNAVLTLESVTTPNETSGMEFFKSSRSGHLMMGLIDMEGQAMIPSGQAENYRIIFRRHSSTDPTSLILVSSTVASSVTGEDMPTCVRITKDNSVLPQDYVLAPNYPNPFNPETVISFSIPKAEMVTITVYNVLGQEVKVLGNELFAAGTYQVSWDGTDASGSHVASGVYFYRLRAGQFEQSRKMLLLK